MWLVYNLWSRWIQNLCVLRKSPGGCFAWLSGRVCSTLRICRATVPYTVWKQRSQEPIIKAGEGPPCMVAQGVRCASATGEREECWNTTHWWGPSRWMDQAGDIWTLVKFNITKGEAARRDVPSNEARCIGHHQRIILAKTTKHKTKTLKPNRIHPLDQGSSNYGPLVKSSLLPDLVNKVSLGLQPHSFI